jgi:hypothetical protein
VTGTSDRSSRLVACNGTGRANSIEAVTDVSCCALCPHANSGFCKVVLRTPSDSIAESRPWQRHRVVTAGKLVISRNQVSSDLFVLCGGWAVR